MNETNNFKRCELVPIEQLVPGSVVNIKGFSCMFEGEKEGKAIFTRRAPGGRGAFVFMKFYDKGQPVRLMYLCHEQNFQPLSTVNTQTVSLKKLEHTSLMPFGKYKNRTMQTVPAGYLIWMFENNYLKAGPVRDYITENLNLLKSEMK